MRFNHELDYKSYSVRAYQPGEIHINLPITNTDDKPVEVKKQILTSSFIMAPHQLIENWPPQTIPALTLEHLAQVLPLDPEVVILGTGQKLEFPEPFITAPLLNSGIGVEVMDSAAACRTYNILMQEGRHVVAALIVN